MKQKLQQGFTLIELMIVVAIIGVLASIAVPTYQDYIARAQLSEGVILAEGLKTAVAEHFAQTGVCPENDPAAAQSLHGGIGLMDTITGKYIWRTQTVNRLPRGCDITAFFKNTGVSVGLQGKHVQLSMAATATGSIVWTCQTDVEQKYAPKACVAGTLYP